ncbi:MAG: hypothetical protein KF788_02905 [Piscinibacter sp.]|nr:hypothetical protein [Piscinibacter sp.]
MKYLLLLVAVLVLLWLLRGSRRGEPPPPPAAPGESSARPVVACRHCGVHLPRDEALPGRGGVFCGEAHRAEYERQHPAG